MSSEVMEIFTDFLKARKLSFTNQREKILNMFLKTEKHLSVDELYELVRKRSPRVGHTTVFRTLKLLSEAGIAKEVDLGDSIARYEHKYGHEHHDHLVCTKCGRFIEAVDPQIEELQERLCGKFDFLAKRHRMEIYGVCKECRK